MRLDVVILGALVVAGSASIFGGLGRAASPETIESVAETVAPAAAAPVAPAACTRLPGRPAATSLQFLEPGTYAAADFDTGCDAAR